MPLRELTGEERRLLNFLLEPRFPGRNALARQAETLRTEESSCGCGCPSLDLIPDRTLPPAAFPADSRVVCQADGTDSNGNPVGVLLWVDSDGYLADIEVFEYDDVPYAGLPDPSALRICDVPWLPDQKTTKRISASRGKHLKRTVRVWLTSPRTAFLAWWVSKPRGSTR